MIFLVSTGAASKKGAESLAYTYHYLYGIDITIPRYFTIYGPAGRPDMSIFNYIDDIAKGSIAAIKQFPSSSGQVGFEIINLGSDRPVKMNYVINLIEQYLGKKAQIEFQPRHRADVPATWADISKAKELLSWRPLVSIEEGIQNTVTWYLENRDWVRNVGSFEL